jgi:hypothetical protein
MEYFQFTVKVPIPSRRWFRFRLKSLLLLMLLTAFLLAGWRVLRNGEHARLQQNLRNSKAARDIALNQWRQSYAAWKRDGASGSIVEVTARARYFERRAFVEADLERLVHFRERYGENN